MTIVAAWVSYRGTVMESLRCVTDARLSTRDGESIFPLTDAGTKLFSIPINIYRPSPSGGYTNKYFSSSLGLAYCGDSLIGLTLASTLSSITNQLVDPRTEAKPSLEDIANLSVRIATKLKSSMHAARPESEHRSFRMALLGWCPTRERYELRHFSSTSWSPAIRLENFDLEPRASAFLMGDRVGDIRQEIESWRMNLGGAAWEEAPETIVRRFSHEGGIASVGGLIQTGRGTRNGFYLWPTIQYVDNGGKIDEKVMFRGLDVYEEINPIGPCTAFIGQDGILADLTVPHRRDIPGNGTTSGTPTP